jgi:glyoxylase-like metal-dependent hydrolase (beta-lactamase superfamily II)
MPYRDVGKVRLHRLIEAEAQFEHRFMFPEVTPDQWLPYREWLQPRAWDPVSGNLVVSVQSFLLIVGDRKMVVDTCVGDHKRRWRPAWHMTAAGEYLNQLRALDTDPDDIELVITTHMHADHVGWNTRLEGERWVPTFKNARYVFVAGEWRSWKSRHELQPVPQIGDSVLPIIQAGRADLVASDAQITDEIRIIETPGHTAGHVSVLITSEDQEAVITGDIFHSPIQCREPAWATGLDLDEVAATRTRRAFLARYSETGTLVCGTHFPSPSFGHIVRDEPGYSFVFENETHPH